MAVRINEHGQPIGPVLDDWEPRAAPSRVTMVGRYVTVDPLSAEHRRGLFEALCGPEERELWTYRADDPPQDEAHLARMISALATSGESTTFALVPEGSQQAHGMATLLRSDPANGSAEIGAILYGRALQRTRAATEAIRLLGAYLFDDLGYRRLEWKCDALNQPSRDAAVRLGFVEEGTFRNALVYKGRNRDTTWFSITDSEWFDVREAIDAWLDPANFNEQGLQRKRLADVRSA